MEAFKKILNPNKDQEGTATSTSGPTSAQGSRTGFGSNPSGQGSHFTETRSGMPGAAGSQVSSHMPGEFPVEASNSGAEHETAYNQPVQAARKSGSGTDSPTYGGTSAQAGLSGDSTHPQDRTTGASATTTSGPHPSNLANRADPRVDSDGSRIGGGVTGDSFATGHPSSGVRELETAQIDNSATDRGYEHGSGNITSSNAGPHSSPLANRADPTLDSDFDGPTTPGVAVVSSTTTARSFPLTGGSASTTSGPHSSNIANKADPRVDSDNSRLGGSGVTGTSTNTTGHGNTSDAYGNPTTGSGSHHTGRDAAAIGAGAAAGSAALRGFNASSGPHQTDTANLLDPNISGSSQREDGTHHHEHRGQSHAIGGGAEEADSSHRNIGTTSADSTRIADTDLADRTRQPGNISSSHMGRNAAIGAGVGTGAAGSAKHEHDKHQAERSTGPVTSSATTGTTTTTTTTTGPHSSDLANKVDPRVDSDNSKVHPSHVGHSTTNPTGHHHGNETALGVGAGLGAAGLASHGDHSTRGPITEGAFDQSGNQINPSQSTATASGREHHYGRDAAVAGGAAGVGAAAYGTSQHHQEQTSGVNPVSQSSSQAHPVQGITGSQASGVGMTGTTGHTTANPIHSSNTTRGPLSSNTTDPSRTGTSTDRSQTGDHHYGRDAAVAGGAGGAAAYAVNQHQKERQLEKAEKKEQKHAEKDANDAQKHAQKQIDKGSKHSHKEAEKHAHKDQKHAEKEAEHKKKGGLFGFLHRDKGKDDGKYTPEEHAELDRLERENLAISSHKHEGQAAALGGAPAGAGAYEAGKHHGTAADTTSSEQKDIGDHLHGQRNRGIIGSSGFPDTEGFASGELPTHEGFGTTGTAEHHYGRDAAAVGGVGGAAALGKHEYDQHHNAPTGTTGTSTRDVGSTHTGIHSGSAGDVGHSTAGTHAGSTATADHHYGRDATAVGGVGGAAALGKHEYEQHHNTTGTSGNATGGIGHNTAGTHTGTGVSDHHHGRDAATVGGVGGAAALGKHEYDQHHYTPHTSGPSTGGIGDNTTGTHTGTSATDHHHHHGRDAAAVGGAGDAAALGKHEYDQHHSTATGGVGSSHTGTGGVGSTGPSEYDHNKNYTGSTLGSDLGSSAAARRLSEAETDQDGNTIGGHSIPSVYQTGAAASDRNRLHKDPPAGHPAREVATTGTHTTHGAIGTSEAGQNTGNLDTNSRVQGSGGYQY